MNSEALINVCQAAIHGNDRFVRNLKDNREGRIINCSNAGFEVQVAEKTEVWGFQECEVKEPESTLRSA